MSGINLNEQEAGTLGFWHRYRLLIIVAAIGIAIIGWLYVSKGIAVRQAQETVAAQRAEWVKQAEARQAEMVKQSRNQFGVPPAWARHC